MYLGCNYKIDFFLICFDYLEVLLSMLSMLVDIVIYV